jgi:ribosomal protein S18 acetylase RimI-like enzyme
MGWMYPLFWVGIYEDLRNRLYSKTKHYACLVAVGIPGAGNISKASSPHATSASEDRNLVVGTVELARRSYPLFHPRIGHCLYISNLAVETEYRRRGIAYQLLSACEHMALEWGYQDLYLHVLEDNHAARRLYTKVGYKLQGTEAGLSSWLLGHPRQLFLRKSLHGN